MAVITPSSIISEIRGSVGDVTYSRNRFGPYVKQKLVQPASDTPDQQLRRQAVTEANTYWKQMSDETFLLWKDYVINHLHTNPISRKFRRSAFNEYTSRFLNRSLLSSAVLNFQPLPAVRIHPFITSISLAFEEININWASLVSPGTTAIAVYATAPVPSSKRSFNQSDYRFLEAVNVSTTTGTIDVYNSLNDRYTLLPGNVGDRVGICIKAINTDNFAASEFSYSDFIVTSDVITSPPMVVQQTTAYQSSGTSFNISFPSTPQAGELILLFAAPPGNVTLVAPSGFTTLDAGSGASLRQRIYYKIAGGSETNVYTITASISTSLAMIGFRISNYNSVTPVVLGGSNASLAVSVSNINASSANVNVPVNSLAFGAFYTGTTRSATTYTNSFGDEVVDPSGGGLTYIYSIARKQYLSAEATSNVNGSWSPNELVSGKFVVVNAA